MLSHKYRSKWFPGTDQIGQEKLQLSIWNQAGLIFLGFSFSPVPGKLSISPKLNLPHRHFKV